MRLDDEADDDGRGHAGEVSDEIEQATVDADEAFGRCVGDDGPAQCAESFAEKSQGHEKHDTEAGADVVAGNHGHRPAACRRRSALCARMSGCARAQQSVGDNAAQNAAAKPQRAGRAARNPTFTMEMCRAWLR